VPWLGRYAEVDPVGMFGEDRNLYGYVYARPGSFTDASGESGGRGSGAGYDSGKTVCDGCGGFKWVWKNKSPRPPCATDCVKKHEEDHIKWFEKNKPGACSGLPGGANPDTTPPERDDTECRDYKVSLKCHKGWTLRSRALGSSCRSYVKGTIQGHKRKIRKHCHSQP